MEHNYAEYERYGEIVLRAMRIDAGLSQIDMADAMGIAAKTVSYWETGKACPDATQAWDWYNACKLNPTSYIMKWRYPNRFEETDEATIQRLGSAIHLMRPDDRKRLLYAIIGDHGSFWPAVLQLIMAHLHLPMRDRIESAILVEQKYLLLDSNKPESLLVHKDKPLPDMDMFGRGIAAGKDAYTENRDSYTL